MPDSCPEARVQISEMFSLFRIRSVDRLLLLAAFLLLTRLGLFLFELPYIVPEIPWWLVGEKVLGGSLLYRDVLDDCPPVVALVYAGLSFLAPRSELVSVIVGSALVFVQALLFNRICTRFGQIDDRSYMPAAMYLLLANLSFDFAALSPPMLALTALMPALSRVYTHIRVGLEEHRVHETGFWIGLASLCYMPSAVFIFFAAACFLLYTGTRPRWYAVLGIGFLFPFIVAGFLFYFADAFPQFIDCYVRAPFSLEKQGFMSFGFLSAMMLPPLALTVWAALRTMAHRGYINFQVVSNTVMIFWAAAALLSYPLSTWHQPACLWLIIPAAAYFLAQWSYLVKKAILRELLLTALLGHTLLALYMPYLPLRYLRTQFLKQGLVYFPPKQPVLEGRRMLVMGSAMQDYIGNIPATPFLDRRLAARVLDDTTDYQVRFKVYTAFRQDMPDVIVDADSTLPAFLRRMPILARDYAPQPGMINVWFRVHRQDRPSTETVPDSAAGTEL